MKSLAYNEATIAAIATPVGPGAIGVIKVSGRDAEAILRRIFRPRRRNLKEFQSHRLYYGHIIDPETQTVIDEVLVTLMRAPHTYTREDVLEIYAHSGYLILTKILELVLRSGARLAEPGEFTRRAFLNGRLDLSQAEAVQELITARSEQGLRLALNQLQGGLSQRLHKIRDHLLSALAVVEVAVDFPEEDVEVLSSQELARKLEEQVYLPIKKLLEDYREGRLFREGMAVVIAGRPNVGKSSLLNALLKEERAIVTPIPGTTRDIIEEVATIRGLPVRLIDTAGLRETADVVEGIGVKKAKEKIQQADIVLFMVDGSKPPCPEDLLLYQEVASRTHLVVINKIDISSKESLTQWEREFPNARKVFISAKEHKGLSELYDAVFELVIGQKEVSVPEIVPNLRQKIALERALEALDRALKALEAPEVYPELIAVDLREALASLGEITGEVTTEDLLDRIFSQFCLGK